METRLHIFTALSSVGEHKYGDEASHFYCIEFSR